MHATGITFVVAFLVDVSHGRRVQPSVEQFQRASFAESQKPTKKMESIIIAKLNRYGKANKALHPVEELAQLFRAHTPEAAFQATARGLTSALQSCHRHACELGSRSRAVHLQEVNRAPKKTQQQQLEEDLKLAANTYKKSTLETSKEDMSTRRDVLGNGVLGAVLGGILGFGIVLGTQRDKEKSKSELVALKARLKEQDMKLRERENLFASPSENLAKLNNRDALKEAQRQLEEKDTELREVKAVWLSALGAATSAEQESKRKDALLVGLGLVAAAESFLLLRGNEANAEAATQLEEKGAAKKVAMEKAAASIAAELEAMEAAKEAALKEAASAAAAELRAATLSKEKALEEASAAASEKLEAAMQQVSAAKAEAAEKERALQGAQTQLQEAKESAAKELQAVEAEKEFALKLAAAKLKAAEAAKEAAYQHAADAADAAALEAKPAVDVARREGLAKASPTKAKKVDLEAAAVSAIEEVAANKVMESTSTKTEKESDKAHAFVPATQTIKKQLGKPKKQGKQVSLLEAAALSAMQEVAVKKETQTPKT